MRNRKFIYIVICFVIISSSIVYIIHNPIRKNIDLSSKESSRKNAINVVIGLDDLIKRKLSFTDYTEKIRSYFDEYCYESYIGWVEGMFFSGMPLSKNTTQEQLEKERDDYLNFIEELSDEELKQVNVLSKGYSVSDYVIDDDTSCHFYIKFINYNNNEEYYYVVLQKSEDNMWLINTLSYAKTKSHIKYIDEIQFSTLNELSF